MNRYANSFLGFRNEYLNTVFISDPPPATGWPTKFAVITAHDPDGQSRSEDENLQADTRLVSRLKDLQLAHWRVSGCSPDFKHKEAGYAIVCDEITGSSLASEFRQEAFYWVVDGVLSLVPTYHRKEVPVALWESRLRVNVDTNAQL